LDASLIVLKRMVLRGNRSVVGSDQGLLASANAAATAGTLRGFALESTQPQRVPAGQYDKGTAVVTLPASSFTSTGTAPSADLHSVLHVQAMVVDFASKSYADSNKVQTTITPDGPFRRRHGRSRTLQRPTGRSRKS
jgi:hypothetical protein